MTIPEEAGKVATSTIDALKASPALLVLVLLQLSTLGVIYVASEHNRAAQHERELLVLRSCFAGKLNPDPYDPAHRDHP
jgi:hypothetical protein